MSKKRSRTQRRFWALGAVFSGLVLALAPTGAGAEPKLTVLHAFQGGSSDGDAPNNGQLIADEAGNLYGMTFYGGKSGCLDLGHSGCGTIYRLAPDGTGFTVLHSFSGGPSDGAKPFGGLLGRAGTIFGATYLGGLPECPGGGCGTVFKIQPNGTGFTLLHRFAGNDGRGPFPGLIADHRGKLYGSTNFGGTGDAGTIFKVASDGTGFAVLHQLNENTDGFYPKGELYADGLGNLYGVTENGPAGPGSPSGGGGTVFKLARDGTYSVLKTFCKGTPSLCRDGVFPGAGLIADSAGNLYGTTHEGGAFTCDIDCGLVFKLAPDLTYKVLHRFSIPGNRPAARLLADAEGTLYGTTSRTGGSYGGGAVFKLSPDGTGFKELHSFAGDASDGDTLLAGLVADSEGNLYGTSFAGGGGAGCGGFGCGTVYKLSGTGFVPRLAFANLTGKLAIRLGSAPHTDTFQLSAAVTLAAKSAGIYPPTEKLKLRIGTYEVKLLPGSFMGPYGGPFDFSGVVDGATLRLHITQGGSGRFSVEATATGASLTGTTNPVPVFLALGDDDGQATIVADLGSPWRR